MHITKEQYLAMCENLPSNTKGIAAISFTCDVLLREADAIMSNDSEGANFVKNAAYYLMSIMHQIENGQFHEPPKPKKFTFSGSLGIYDFEMSVMAYERQNAENFIRDALRNKVDDLRIVSEEEI